MLRPLTAWAHRELVSQWGSDLRQPKHRVQNLVLRSQQPEGRAMTFAGTVAAQAADNDDEMLIKALAGAKITLLEGIAQIVEGSEVRTQARHG
jgi:hypothetical protein